MNARAARRSEDGAALREQGLQITMRLVATLRTGRSYSIGNLVFTRQLEQLLDVLLPVLREHGRAALVSVDGDLHLNDVRLPLRASSLKFLEQLAQELQVREIGGVEFLEGLGLGELEDFMRYFLPSELYKGGELDRACAAHGLRHVAPVEAPADGEPAGGTAGAPGHVAGDRHAYARALQAAEVLLARADWSHGLELRHLKRISQPLVDEALRGEGAGALSAVPRTAGTSWGHAVHVCVLAIEIGHRLGLDRAELSELGVAALLHDAGRPAAGSAGAGGHTLEGVRRIARATNLNATSLAAMRAALEHHAGGPAGHPPLPPGWRVSPVSQVVAIADAFVSLLEHGGTGRPALTPVEALGRVLGPLSSRFHPGLRAALVRALGVYPPGQLVELDDGSLACSLGGSPEDPERPRVEWLAGPGGAPPGPGVRAAGPLPAARSVQRALPYAEWPARGRAA